MFSVKKTEERKLQKVFLFAYPFVEECSEWVSSKFWLEMTAFTGCQNFTLHFYK